MAWLKIKPLLVFTKRRVITIIRNGLADSLSTCLYLILNITTVITTISGQLLFSYILVDSELKTGICLTEH